MVFFAQKVLRKVAGNWTFVVVIDRVELDDQIAKAFKATPSTSQVQERERPGCPRRRHADGAVEANARPNSLAITVEH